MPELPEVQTTVNGIARYAKGLRVTSAWTDYNSPYRAGKGEIKNPKYFKTFPKAVIGAKISGATRRGKNVLVHLDNGKTILIHMKMTGHVMYGDYKMLAKKDEQGETWRPKHPERDKALADPFNRFIHFALGLSSGKTLVLSDMRKFAKVALVDTADLATSEHLSTHGPEPLEKSFDANNLHDALMRRPNMAIKQALMDLTLISGIGNIYSDEILWRVGVHPLSRVKDVPAKLWPVMHKAMRETLLNGIDFGGDSMSDYRNILGERGKFQNKHHAYRKTGEPCSKPRCTGTIKRLKVGGRSAHFCDTHQKLYT